MHDQNRRCAPQFRGGGHRIRQREGSRDRERDIAAALSLLPVGAFTVEGPRAASDSARVEAGANLYLTKSAALFGSFIGEFSNRGSIYSGNGGVRVIW